MKTASPPRQTTFFCTSLDVHTQKGVRETDVTGDPVRNLEIARALRARGHYRQADRLESCERQLGYRRCRCCGDVTRMIKTFCDLHRLCPTCARINRRRIVGELTSDILRIQFRPVVGFGWKFLTTTLKTDDDYRQIQTAIAGFGRLWRTCLGGKRRPQTACMRAIEIGPAGGTIHIHTLYYGPYIQQVELSEKWEICTGSLVVDVRAVPGPLRDEIPVRLRYILKYPDLSLENRVAWWEAVRRRHLTQRFGLLRTSALEEWTCGLPMPTRKADPDQCPTCGSREWKVVSQV